MDVKMIYLFFIEIEGRNCPSLYLVEPYNISRLSRVIIHVDKSTTDSKSVKTRLL